MSKSKKSKQPSPKLQDIFTEIRTSLGSNRVCVLVVHGFIELLVNALVEKHCKHAKRIVTARRDYTHAVKLVMLHEMGIITDAEFGVLDGFRDMRNDAAHLANFIPDPNFVNKITAKLPSGISKAFPDVCVMIFGSFWNNHKDVFAPLFHPTGNDQYFSTGTLPPR